MATLADAQKETAAPATIVDAADQPYERGVMPQFGDMAAFSREIFQFMMQRRQAYAQTIGELQQCRTFADILDVQIRFNKSMLEAYASEAAKLTGMAMSTTDDTVERLKQAA